MAIDQATRKALEWRAVCALVAGHTSAEAARRALEAWRPFEDPQEARTALEEVVEAMDLAGESRLPAPHVEDQSTTIETLGVEGAMLDGPGLLSAAHTLRGIQRMAAFVEREPERWPRLGDRLRRAPDEREWVERILDAFDTEARLLDRASTRLGRLRGAVRARRSEIVESLDALISRLPHVLVASDSRPTVREGRYVVPLRREALSDVPGIVHDESSSGATVFLEPRDVVERNNLLRQDGLAVRREEERILRELTAGLAERRGELERAARLALHVETLLARARYARSTEGHAPSLEGDAIELNDARHPLLLARAAETGADVVPLDLTLDADERALIVSGPNTGGKTILLKTVGTVALMAQAGIVPPIGAESRLPWHAAIVADIGDTQSIERDLSTFTAHLTRLKAAWEAAGPETLILVDEIGASTDPAEGSALASALLEGWTDRGARTIVTTHYYALKVLAGSHDGLVNGSLAYDLEANRPLYRFVKGVPGRSYGLELADRWGFGEDVVARARDALDAGVLELDDVLERLTEQEARYAEAVEALEAERRAVGDAESARARRMAAEASERREAAERRLEELEEKLDRLRDEVRSQQSKLRDRTAELSEAQAALESSRSTAEEASRMAEELRSERDAMRGEVERPPISVGDLVRIPRYDVTGEVEVLDREDDEAAVAAGGVRITCRASECELVERAEDRTEAPGSAPAELDTTPDVEPVLPLEIDLRGLRVHEVGHPVADALERAYRTGRPRIRFIHGKGMGVLRQKVGEILESHPYVESFRVGRWNEGGNGVTIASLEPEGEDGA